MDIDRPPRPFFVGRGDVKGVTARPKPTSRMDVRAAPPAWRGSPPLPRRPLRPSTNPSRWASNGRLAAVDHHCALRLRPILCIAPSQGVHHCLSPAADRQPRRWPRRISSAASPMECYRWRMRVQRHGRAVDAVQEGDAARLRRWHHHRHHQRAHPAPGPARASRRNSLAACRCRRCPCR